MGCRFSARPPPDPDPSAAEAGAEHVQWQLWQRLDSSAEADMVQVTRFLRSLLEHLPETSEDEPSAVPTGVSLSGVRVEETLTVPSAPTPADAAALAAAFRAGRRLAGPSAAALVAAAEAHLGSLPNITRVALDGPLHVVGDLHGQLRDLLHIFELRGFPSASNRFLFNGDFVDRGPDGAEIVLLLYALRLALPEAVFLTRGNHEERAICTVYGFEQELRRKWPDGDALFEAFVASFEALPIAALLTAPCGKRALVVHGGLFSTDGVTLADIDAVPRRAYSSTGPGHELMRDLLWSDPMARSGRKPNPRGVSVLFGPDVTQAFLEANDVSLLVRSHEAVADGVQWPQGARVVTVFSASNYEHARNRGAVLTLRSDLTTQTERFSVSGESGDRLAHIQSHNAAAVARRVLKHKRQLRRRLGAGHVPVEQWAAAMREELGIDVDWPALLPMLMGSAHEPGPTVDVARFLKRHTAQFRRRSSVHVDGMYARLPQLEAIFRFFDQNQSGFIDAAEFRRGVEVLNEHVPTQPFSDVGALMAALDLKGDDRISVNEFCEAFRLVGLSN